MVGEHLSAAGVLLDLGLLEAGALLHDIAKTATLHNGAEHARLGAQWLSRPGVSGRGGNCPGTCLAQPQSQ